MEKEHGAEQRDASAGGEKPAHHENIIEEVAEELESRFLAAAEVATSTTSPEVNLVDAVVRGLEGQPHDDKPGAPDQEDEQRAASATVEDEPDPQGSQAETGSQPGKP